MRRLPGLPLREAGEAVPSSDALSGARPSPYPPVIEGVGFQSFLGGYTTTPWFSAAEEPALRDFWSVYDANFDVVVGALARSAPERRDVMLTEAAHESVRRAMLGAWEEHEEHFRSEAASYARRGLSFGTWHAIAAELYAQVTPLLLDAYLAEPLRLRAALAAMHQYGRRAIAVLGEAYVTEREAMSREVEAAGSLARVRAESRFARLFDSGILGVIIGTVDRRILEINDAALAMVGYTREEIVSGEVRWADLTPPEFTEHDAFVGAALRRTGISSPVAKEYVHRDGHRVPVLVGSAMVDGVEGITVILDLTDRRRAEAESDYRRAVHAGEQLFRTLVDAVPDYAICMLDAKGRIETWNDGAQRLKGYLPSEVIGKDLGIFYADEDRETGAPAAELAAAVRDGLSIVQGWRVRRDGSRFWADVAISAMKDPLGNVLGFAKVTRDLTALQANARALDDATHELEAFSYSVAHDLRAPLRGMSGFAHLLIDTYGPQLDDEARDWLGEILVNANKMGALIDALLSLGQVTRGELRRERVDLSVVAAEALAQLAEDQPERSVVVAIEPGLTVDMDPSLARVLIENLVSNAWKFSAQRTEAHIDVGAREDSGARTFYVRDDGAGFDMAYASKLFGPFQRLHTQTEFPGTGIGLATVQRIVRRHGGRTWATGTVGGGATFYFTVPNTK